MFEVGKTAEERRVFRSARRRRQRAVERRGTLRILFESEINKADKAFYKRLDESFFWADDKSINQKNILFNDSDFSDKDYNVKYPTIYHLRNELIENKTDKFDIRLIYLAIEHILKHRGHFLYGGSDMETAMNFKDIYADWCKLTYDMIGEDMSLTETELLCEILKKSAGVTQKKKELKALFGDKAKCFVELLSGASVQVVKLFGEQYSDCEPKTITFKGDSFDVDKDNLESVIGEDNLFYLEKTKALYDWGVLAEILKGNKYLSKAKIEVYNKHKSDLEILKRVLKSTKFYKDMFQAADIKGNYASYIGMTKKNGKKQPVTNCTCDDFYKYVKKCISSLKGNSEVDFILNEIENGTFMPKQITKDNSVIPYQIHLAELRQILSNASKHHSFLNEKDEYGTVADKIESLLTFRIPYYIGPLNSYHDKYSWIEKKNDNKIYPWNFNDIVNKEKSAENFILRMTNYCTYIPDEPVLAKNSVLYSKYMVFNELNNIKINGAKLSILAKNEIYNTIYLNKSKPRLKDIRQFVKINSGDDAEVDISGINEELSANMKSYIDFKNIIGEKVHDEIMVDEIIRLITIFGDEREMLVSRIRELYGNVLTDDEIKRISSLKYSGWGNFSRKLLTEVRSEIDNSNIIELLMNTEDNFMQIIYNETYGIKEQLEKFKEESLSKKGVGTYESLSDLYVSPSNRKRIWRVMVIIKEIVKVMGDEPQKIFIEMARGTDENNDKRSRKKQLTELYDSIKNEKELTDALMNETESTLRSKKLYLYYRQLGRCMYSGKQLSVSDLDMCDIDHIVPRAKKDDDSLDNTVLVFKKLNAIKSDKYPIPDDIVSDEARKLWEILKDKGFITKEKYNRLTRKTPLTVDELADFVERQLVETRQVTKVVSDVMKNMYKSSEIVYVKAKNVSSFRNGGYLTKEENNSGEYKDDSITKVREVNDYHHAKDAYLNIVVGNIYNEKFNHNPKFYIRNGGDYHLARLCEKDVPAANWISGHNGTIEKIKAVLRKNNVLYTVMPYEQRGGFFDQMPVKAGGGQFPLKTSDTRLANFERYGGYNKVAGAYMAIVESTVKNKRVKTIETVPVYISDKVKSNQDELIKYFESTGMENVKILLPELKFGTLLKVNSAFVHITGRSGNNYLLCNRVQLCVSDEQEKYIKKIVKYNDSLRKDNANPLDINHNGITNEENIKLYDMFIEKLKTNVYGEFLSAQVKNLEDGRSKFVKLDLGDQNKVLFECLHMFQCNRVTADLSLLGKAKFAGILQLNKKLASDKKIEIINQSPTGLFENRIDIAEL